MTLHPRLLAACVLLAAAAPLAAQSPARSVPGLRVEECTLPGVKGPARCGTLEVWENRTTRSGRKIPLHFVVVPATGGGAPAREAFTYLAGGPGDDATRGAGWMAQLFAPALATRDLLLMDQRGTGKSYFLDCQLYGPSKEASEYLGAFMPAERVRACLPDLRERADVTQYTSDATADDLDEVRAALGYERLDLFGGSYGTRTALVYMRRHPERVRSSILLGVVPTDVKMPASLAADAERSLMGIIGECEADTACRAAFPELRDEVRRSLSHFAEGPVEVEVLNPGTGEMVTIPLTRELYVEAVRYLLYGAGTAGLVPVMVHQAAGGDFGPIGEVALDRRMNLVNVGSHGLYLAVTCAEDVPFIAPGEGERLAEGTFVGDYRLRDQRAACAEWPRAAVDRSFLDPVVSDAPTLILSGEWDPATPPSRGEQAARTLRNSLHVVVPSGAHGFGGLENAECVDRVMNDFIVRASVAGLDTSCVSTIRRRGFRTAPIETRAAAVSPERLARYAGSYSGPGWDAEVRVENGSLRLVTFEGETVIVPLSETRFRMGGNVGLVLEFETEGEAVRAVRVEQDGVVTATLTRK